MSTPLDEKTSAAIPITLDNLAAALNTGYEGFEGGQRHRAARYLLAPPPEGLVQLGRIYAVQPDELMGDRCVDLAGVGRCRSN